MINWDWEFSKEQLEFLEPIDKDPQKWMTELIFQALYQGLLWHDYEGMRSHFLFPYTNDTKPKTDADRAIQKDRVDTLAQMALHCMRDYGFPTGRDEEG